MKSSLVQEKYVATLCVARVIDLREGVDFDNASSAGGLGGDGCRLASGGDALWAFKIGEEVAIEAPVIGI